ncbi:MAG: ABC transporter ATP-binding protein [Verrucomicrobiaceae bacterium]|nr:ABC transporter ATP-binding protein [Verrucomicrobiaceae bacterium]
MEPDPHKPSAITCENLSFAWPNPDGTETLAIEGMTFSVSKGEFVAILGPSGCGKSSLLNLIAGLETPKSGTLLVDGKPVSAPDSSRFLMSQSACLFPWLTILQNVEFGPKMHGLSPSERREQAVLMLEAVGLQDWAKSFPHQLSGGMRQRAAVARALVNQPEFLLMDEPFAALDYPARLAMQDFILAVRDRFNPTILFVTHMPEEAIILADRISILAPRPTMVISDMRVDIARPRLSSMPEFAAFIGIIQDSLPVAQSNQQH